MDVREEECEITANFDNKGVVLAVAVYKKDGKGHKQRIDLFDVAKYKQGTRFGKFSSVDRLEQIQDLKFSSNGNFIAASTKGNQVALIDAYEGEILGLYGGISHEMGIPLEASFSPDSNYLFSGSEDGKIFIWDTEKNRGNPEPVVVLEGHVKPCKHIKFNPKFLMMASACQNVILWIPKFLR